MSEPSSREIYAGYEPEYDEYGLVQASIVEEPVDVFLDIGANWGGYSLLAARAGVPQIEAFEPNRKVFGLLAANITLNDFHEQIRAWSIAAGCHDRTTVLSIDPQATDVSSLSPNRMPEKWKYSEAQPVLERRLDTFIRLIGKSVFLKIDVEGYEREVLEGLKSTLSKNRIRLLVEVLRDPDFERFAHDNYGLTVQKRFGSNIYLKNY